MIMFGGGTPTKPYGIEAYSIAVPEHPVSLSFLGAPTLGWFNTENIQITGTTLFAIATSNNSLNALDISVPAAPAVIVGGNLPLGGIPFDHALSPSGTIAVVAQVTGAGLRVVDVSVPSAMAILASVPDVYYGVDTSLWPLVVVTSTTGAGSIRVYDLTVPAAPVLVGSLALSTGVRRLVVDPTTNVAYVATTTGQRIFVVDLSTPSAPALLSTILCSVAGDDTPLHLTTSAGRTILLVPMNAQTVSPGRIQTFDVTNPAVPVFLRGLELGQVIYDLTVNGNVTYVSNRGNPQELMVIESSSIL